MGKQRKYKYMRNYDHTGEVFSRLTVIRIGPPKESNNRHHKRWYCRCECGVECLIPQNNLRAGDRRMCQECSNHHTHGLARHPLYRVYIDMLKRCYSPSAHNYYRYGGRDITVSEVWRDSVAKFIDDMYPTYRVGLTIERIDLNGNYELSNCTWATTEEQNQHKANNRIDADGVVFLRELWATGEWSIKELSIHFNVSYSTARAIATRKTWKNVA